MPRPSDYTPTRRYLMQAVVWGVLGVTLLLAAAVSRSARNAHRVELSKEVVAGGGDIAVRLPVKWSARPRGGEDPRVIAQAAEAPPGQPGRTVRVLREKLDNPMSPLAYLANRFGIATPAGNAGGDAGGGDASGGDAGGGDAGGGDEAALSVVSTAPLGGATAVIVSVERAVPRRGEASFRKDVYAAAVLPSLHAIVVHLSGDGALEAADAAIVRQIASNITLSGAAAEAPAEAGVTLPEGIQLLAPEGFAAVANSDSNRTDRLFWPKPAEKNPSAAADVEKRWASVEVVGVLFPSLEANDPQRLERATRALATLLLVRDAALWRDAKVTAEGNGWRADAAPRPGVEPFPARAYLLPDPSGRALLAVMHGGWSGGGAAFERAWKQLAASAQFLSSSDTAQLEDAGAAEAARLRRAGFGKLLADADEQWWLWTDRSARPHVGWSRLQWTAKDLAGEFELRRRGAGGDATRVTASWSISADGAQYRADASRATSIGTGGAGDAGGAIRQAANLRDGQLTLSVGAAAAATSATVEWKLPAPSQFVPGGPLALVMGTLAPGPLLLRTDSFPGGAECIGAPEPLTIVVRPDPRSARKANGETEPMRCVTASVNGSGRVSRWYFRATGELESVEFPDGVRRVESDLRTLRFDFGKDGQMSP